MRVHQRKIQARVVAETDAASTALREHLPELRQRLESQRMEVERLEIEVEQGESGLGGQTGRQRHGSSDPNQQRYVAPAPAPAAAAPRRQSASIAPAASVSRASSLPSAGVDLRL
jgi:hypothetical protein